MGAVPGSADEEDRPGGWSGHAPICDINTTLLRQSSVFARERIRQRGAGGRNPEATPDGPFPAPSRATIHALGGTTILITRPDPSRPRSSHESEDFAFECDEEVRNDGSLMDLYDAVLDIVEDRTVHWEMIPAGVIPD